MTIRTSAIAAAVSIAAGTAVAAGAAVAVAGAAQAGTIPVTPDGNPTVVMMIHNNTDATMFPAGADLHDAQIVGAADPIAPHDTEAVLISSDDGVGAWGTVGFNLSGHDGYAGSATLGIDNDGITADGDGTTGWNGVDVSWHTTTAAPYARIDYFVGHN